MGVFNGNSIYNFGGGGGGGGYADGGELVYRSLIELQNNTYYTYKDNTANEINFVISGDGVLNSTVDISTDVNSVINVYVDRNGILYKLLCIDNSITAGKDYHLLIEGSNYYIEEIAGLEPVISKAELNGSYIDVYQIGPYVISADLGEYFNIEQFNNIVASTSGKWKKLNNDVIQYIQNNYSISSIRSTSGWDHLQGDNSSGLNFYPYGHIEYGTLVYVGNQCNFWFEDFSGGNSNYVYVTESSIGYSRILDEPEIFLRGRLMLAE